MTPEELLKPRYKVIADYPLSKMYFNVGDILMWNDDSQSYKIPKLKYDVSMARRTVEQYPHLFKKLEWWEERTHGDIPYLKTPAGNSVRKVVVIDLQWGRVTFEGGKVRKIKQWLPATKEEYEAFKQSSNIKV